MNTMLDRFRQTLLAHPDLPANDSRLLIEQSGDLAMHYAPFDYIQPNARIVLVGITPGASQATVALRVLRDALLQGVTDEEALRRAKATASFSGPLRANLVAMLDLIGLNRKLGIGSCAEIFADGSDSVHFTSALRYPVFLRGQNYSGTPSIANSSFLGSICDRWLQEEAKALPEAMWIPLGKEPAAALGRWVERGLLKAGQVLEGLPHPSGANAERIAYFLGAKDRATLSAKTDAGRIDAARNKLVGKISGADEGYSALKPLGCADSSSLPAASSEASPAKREVVCTRESDRAERLLASRLERLKSPTSKIAGFNTPTGHHLAIQRDCASIRVWTEDLDFPAGLGTFRPYSPSTPRHSNLDANAPRCALGRAARLWEIEGLHRLERLVDWYAKA